MHNLIDSTLNKDAANFIPITETIPDLSANSDSDSGANSVSLEISRIFSFKSWDLAAEAAQQIGSNYKCTSSLYKNSERGLYYLSLKGAPTSETGFFMACNICSEYGTKENFNSGSMGFLNEHCELIVPKDAINILSQY